MTLRRKLSQNWFTVACFCGFCIVSASRAPKWRTHSSITTASLHCRRLHSRSTQISCSMSHPCTVARHLPGISARWGWLIDWLNWLTGWFMVRVKTKPGIDFFTHFFTIFLKTATRKNCIISPIFVIYVLINRYLTFLYSWVFCYDSFLLFENSETTNR